MNNERRKAIDEVIAKIEALRDMIGEIGADVETLREEEQEYFDNMPESFQSGEKGERAESAISALDDAANDLVNLDLDNLVTLLNAAQE